MLRFARCLVLSLAFVALAESGCDSSTTTPAAPVAKPDDTTPPQKRESLKQNWKKIQPRGLSKAG
jgi:hypothetical protein